MTDSEGDTLLIGTQEGGPGLPYNSAKRYSGPPSGPVSYNTNGPLQSLAAAAWNGGAIGQTPAVALYTVQGNSVLEYRFLPDAQTGISSANPAVSVIVPPASTGQAIFPYTGLAAVSAYDIGENSIDIFVNAIINGAWGVHQYWQSTVGSEWTYGGVIASGSGIRWVSAATYMIGSESLGA